MFLFSNLKVDAFGRLYAVLSINAAVIIFGLTFYCIRKILITRKTLESQEQKFKKISETKQMAYKVIFFALYVTYLSTCSKTANILPLACRSICYTENETQCETFLRADFSINCSSQEFRRPVIVAYFSVIYIILLPSSALVMLWRHSKTLKTSADEDNDGATYSQRSDVIAALSFLFQNYKIRRWYWGFVETGRKVILTSGIILMGAESRAYIGMALILSGFCSHEAYRGSLRKFLDVVFPCSHVRQSRNRCCRIPEEVALSRTMYTKLEKVLFDILVVGANVLVILILLGKHINYYLLYIFHLLLLRDYLLSLHWIGIKFKIGNP